MNSSNFEAAVYSVCQQMDLSVGLETVEEGRLSFRGLFRLDRHRGMGLGGHAPSIAERHSLPVS